MNNSERIALERLFNTPLESGLRSLILLAELAPNACDLNRLKLFDYFLLHSSDVDSGPESLHPPSPFQSSELLVRQELIKRGLRLLIGKGLAEVAFTTNGITYRATDLARPFLGYFDSPYALRAIKTATWVIATFAKMGDGELQEYVDSNLGRWGVEFATELLFEEEIE